jgi:hypothetical protein
MRTWFRPRWNCCLLALRGALGKVYASVPNPQEAGHWVSIRFGQENKPQFRLTFAGGHLVVRVKLQLEGEILSAPGKSTVRAGRTAGC